MQSCARVWFGHVIRMDHQRIPWHALHWEVPRFKRGPDRPRINWRSTVNKDLLRMGITWEEAEVAAHNRSEWRRSVAQYLDAGWINVIYWLSWWCSGWASDSWSKGGWFDSRPGRAIESTIVNSAFHPSGVDKSSIIPACLAGVKTRCVRLCRVAGNTVWSHMASDSCVTGYVLLTAIQYLYLYL